MIDVTKKVNAVIRHTGTDDVTQEKLKTKQNKTKKQKTRNDSNPLGCERS